MELDTKVTKLEDEIKILKSEVQAVLLDLREYHLNNENPFGLGDAAPPQMAAQPIIINQPAPVAQEPPAADDKQENTTSQEERESKPAAVKKPDTGAEPEDRLSKPAGINESDNGVEPANKAEPIAEEIAHEEVKMVSPTEIEPVTRVKPGKAAAYNGRASLATIAGLAQWVAESTKRLGQERVKVILEISEMMGHLTPDIKQVLVKLIDITPDGHSGEVTTRDYLVSLVELASLLGKGDESEVALFSILYQEAILTAKGN